MKLRKDCPGLENEETVKQISKSFFEKTGITYFHWGMLFDDGTAQGLVSDARWHQHYWSKDYYLHSSHLIHQGCYLLNGIDTYSKEIIDFRQNFNFDNKFEIINRIDAGFEIMGFASSVGNNAITNFYVNHLEELRLFGYFFKDKAKHIIRKALSPEKRLHLPCPPSNEPLLKSKDSNICPEQIARYHINGSDAYLTKKEMICLLHFIQGKSAKTIARILHISSRTVEKHLESCKGKTGCLTKSQLFDFAYTHHLFELIKK